jgi:hypothetical protein
MQDNCSLESLTPPGPQALNHTARQTSCECQCTLTHNTTFIGKAQHHPTNPLTLTFYLFVLQFTLTGWPGNAQRTDTRQHQRSWGCVSRRVRARVRMHVASHLFANVDANVKIAQRGSLARTALLRCMRESNTFNLLLSSVA